MFCKNCGSELMEGSAFCVNCGAAAPEGPAPVEVPVIKPDTDTSNQETMVFTPVEEPVVPPVQQTQQFQPVQEQYQQSYQQQSYQQQNYQQQVYQQPQQYQQYQQPVQEQYQPVQEQYYAPPVAAAPVVSTASERASGGSAESKNRTVLIVVIAIVLLAILGVVVAVIALGGDDSGSSTGKNKGGSNNSSIVEDTDPPADRTYTLDSSNMYYDEYVDSESYVLSAVETRYYSRSELSGMTRQQLFLAEREMLARYGCTFNDGDLDEYFYAKSWYTPDAPASNFNESRMTPTERVNLLLLRAMLMEKDGTASNNPYLKENNDVEGWILNFTDASRITKTDVENLSEKALIIAANEIYARRGYIFDDDDLQIYFSSKNWYVPETPAANFDTATLSEIESENYTCLQECAKKLQGVRFSAGNKYQPYYYSYTEYQFPTSDKEALKPWMLEYMSAEELMLARNEIYARYGYSYTNSSLREYFMNCSWYYPTVIPTKLELIHLTKLELANVKLIQAFELNLKLQKGEASPNTKMSYYAKHDFLTMYLPEHWRDNCICIKPNGTAGNMHFYEKYNQEEGYGWVYSIEFVPADSYIPNYSGRYTEVFGYVTTPDGSQYAVLKITPTSDDDIYLDYVYDLMQSQVDTIWDSIVWKTGYTFTPA